MSNDTPILKIPSKATLKRYGLSIDEWELIAEKQGRVCFVCKKLTSTGRLAIDHEHVKGWKKMPPNQRKLYVRGLLCWFCNSRYLSRGITIDKLRNGLEYLQQYENSKNGKI